jgi:DNA helicase HerA-like ATPase
LFLAGSARVKIYNPDIHPVSKGVAFKNTSLEDMTIAEKTRIIAEKLFMRARVAGESATAKYLLVLEEAHSLVPERNSAANPGDEHAANGTAKVILQGRKYGLGSLIITQRTANVSKSILNQCNTMFALRVFDDTGKAFLQNYIGSDYADTLPTLEERHAIVVGRGPRLKQPVIVQLNDREYFTAPATPAAPAAQPVMVATDASVSPIVD